MVVGSIEGADQRLRRHTARRKWYRRWLARSAVAMILREVDSGLEILMIERAQCEGDPWSGHMAFPGGRAEPPDRHSLDTARRETREEIGLETDRHTRYLGRLSDLLSRRRPGSRSMVITPHLFSIAHVPPLSPNREVADVVWIPLNFLADSRNRRQMQWRGNGMVRDLPCYDYRDRRIWGLSLAMLDELLLAIEK